MVAASSAAAVPFGRPIWVSHTDSACTAAQCWNSVDICWYKNHYYVTSLTTTTAIFGLFFWLPRYSGFDLLSIFRLRYWYCSTTLDVTMLDVPMLDVFEPLGPRPLQPTDSSSGYFDTPAWIFLWLFCAPTCASPPATPTPSACLSLPSPPSAPTPAPSTCHPSLSLSSGFSLLRCRTPVYTTTTTTTTTTTIVATAHCHLHRQDVFVCIKATCNKNLDLDFAPRITSEQVLVPFFHNHIWLSISLCHPDAKTILILSFSF